MDNDLLKMMYKEIVDLRKDIADIKNDVSAMKVWNKVGKFGFLTLFGGLIAWVKHKLQI